MSEDKQASVDEGELEQAKGSLEHVETKEGGATARPVFKCEECGEKQDIPDEVLDKMEQDEDVTTDLPEHCGQKMKISVEAEE